MAEIKNITDKEGEVVYPVTKINAVYTQDNKRLDNVMLTVGDSVGSTDAVINAQTLDGKTLDEIKESVLETTELLGVWNTTGNKTVKDLKDYKLLIIYALNTSTFTSTTANMGASAFNLDILKTFSSNGITVTVNISGTNYNYKIKYVDDTTINVVSFGRTTDSVCLYGIK